jgi:putative ABC transport system permease protein
MRSRDLVRRGVFYYWRTNVAVVLGVATAVAVLAGALLVGDSVRGSLRDLVLERIGRTDRAVVSSGFFREALADELARDGGVTAATPLFAVEGTVSEQVSSRRASRVLVYGVDDRFWRFHDVGGVGGPSGRDALVSPALAADLGATVDSTVLVRIERPSAIPIESLHGRKEDAGRTLRLDVRAILAPADLGEFSLRPQQGAVRAIFVPLARIQQDLDLRGRVNTLLVSGGGGGGAASLDALVRARFALEDVGLTTRVVGDAVAVESAAGLIDAPRVQAIESAVQATGIQSQAVLTYLANVMRSGERTIPYSLVTAIDLRAIGVGAEAAQPRAGKPPIVINDWAARDLAVKPGDPLTLEYFLWEDPGRLITRAADFTVAAVVPIAGAAADRDLAPVYPGISEAATFSDWDPPFPVDLKRVRKIDEDYWDQYRTTPKAFVPIDVGQSLWRSRYGDRTAVRLRAPEGASPAETTARFTTGLRTAIDPLAMGLSIVDVRASGLAASRGATDFGEYFTYFSFFLVAAALLLAVLFFRLAVEQRAREVGLLRAVGFSTPRVRRLFAAEGLVLALAGAAIGAAGAVAYAGAMMYALRTWWIGAVATTSLTLHVSPLSLGAGVAATLVAAMVCIWWTLRRLAKITERSLLAGEIVADDAGAAGVPGKAGRRRSAWAAIAFAILGVAMVGATAAGAIDQTAGFFGAGTFVLVACLCLAAATLRRPPRSLISGHGWPAVARLGLRNAAHRPGRSVLAIGVIASAAFILIAVDAFHKEAPSTTDRRSGVGGYSLLVDLLMPIAHDPNSREGRDAIGLADVPVDQIALEPFRVRRGDDASCLNLYEPRDPRILGVRRSFIDSGRFAFQGSIAATDAERANPWLLLNGGGGADDPVPVIADANSMSYVLHKALGDVIVVDRGGRPLRLRLVAALSDSLFQGELLMSDEHFRRIFPDEDGYRFLLIEAPADRAGEVASAIEQGAGDLGADAVPTLERLAEFHAVENTYLSTFKTLGGLGLLVGTIGLAAVLLRNVLERRRELALLGAAGYRRGHIFAIVLAENVLLLGWGLAVGALSAAVAIAPVALERGGQLPAATSAATLVIAVFAGGLLSSFIATRAALGAPLLEALRSE